MSSILAATRAVHFASTLLVFGGIAFAVFVARPMWRDAGDRPGLGWESVERRIRVMSLWALAISVLTALFWLALEVPLMSGEKLEDALAGPTLGIVITQTWFGRVWSARVVLAVLLFAFLVLGGARAALSFAALVLSAAYAALPALAGHAAGGLGMERYIRITADMLHLIAAGAWIGALPALAMALIAAKSELPSVGIAARVAQRFSLFGTISVTLLVVTGTINGIYLVRSMSALFDTEYGRLLLAKLALVAAMLALAALNRWSLSPRLVRGEPIALGALVRNTALEIVAGVGVIAVVGVLGITVPAMHPSHHELHSDTSRAIIPGLTGFERPWPNPTSSTNRFRKANTTIWKRSSDPMPFRRTAWISRCSTVS